MIEATGLTKVYGDKTAVDGVSFTVKAGHVTGFLGPNGAGKSTTMRMIMGLDRPTAGSVTVNGVPFAQHAAPLREIGSLLDAKAVHTGRTAYNHLLAMAATHGIPRKRVQDVIEMTGLGEVANKKVKGFSDPGSATSTTTISPGLSSEKRIFSARWSSMSRCSARRSGRAPSTGS